MTTSANDETKQGKKSKAGRNERPTGDLEDMHIYPPYWQQLYSEIKKSVGTWEEVANTICDEAGKVGEDRVGRKAAEKWQTRPPQYAVLAACSYAAKNRLFIGRDFCHYKSFKPASEDKETYLAALKGQYQPVGKYPEIDSELEEALSVAAAYICLTDEAREVLRRTAFYLYKSEPRESRYRNYYPDAGAAFDYVAKHAENIRSEFSDTVPEVINDFIDIGDGSYEDNLVYLTREREHCPRDERRVRAQLWRGAWAHGDS